MKYLFLMMVLLGLLFVSGIPKPVITNLKPQQIEVNVTGEVKNSGKFTLDNYSTMEDLLVLLDFTSDAEIQYLNPAQILFHHDLIVIPKKEVFSCISINTATIEQLIRLSGIGDKTATAIIEYREQYGLFHSLEELMNVKGIGKVKFETIKDEICL